MNSPAERLADGGLSPRRLFAVIGTGACVAALAIVAALAGFHRDGMLLIAAGVGSAVALPALFVMYRQIAGRDAAQRKLQDVQARVGGIIESAMDAIISVDEEQRVVQFNAAAEAVFGWPREQAIGAPLAGFIPERFRGAHGDHIKRFRETGTSSRRMGGQRIVTGLRRNGEEFPIDASISQISEGGQHFFTVILRDVTQRVRGEQDLTRSREELKHLALAANNLREQEKSRVARELHDELGQALTALKLDVGWLREGLAGASDDVKHKLASMQLLLDGTVAATRRISADLRPLVLDDLGLAAAADWLAQGFSSRTGVPCELVVSRDLTLGDPHATAVFRALQESLTNIAKHARATKVEVALERTASEVTLTVQDDGIGFSPEEPRKPASYGLLGLKERAYLLGGEVAIQSAPGRGTCIEMRLPTEPAESAP